MKKLTALILALVLVISLIPATFAANLTLGGKVSIGVGETTRWTASQWVWWTSGNPGVATIDQNGNIKALKAGVSNITATAADGTKKTVAITVTSPYPTSISLAGKTAIYVGNRIKWNVNFYPATATNKSVTWASGNPAVASVDQNGNIVAHKAGKANITATTANGIKKTVMITVYNTYHTANSLTVKYNSTDLSTTYKHKINPVYVGERNFVLPYIVITPTKKILVTTFHYTGNNYIFWTDLKIYADGQTFDRSVSYSFNVNHDSFSNDRCSEYLNTDTSSAEDIAMLTAIANASYAYVTFSGSNGSYTHVISAADKQAFKDVLTAYSLMD